VGGKNTIFPEITVINWVCALLMANLDKKGQSSMDISCFSHV
jgi:hypothetical protein